MKPGNERSPVEEFKALLAQADELDRMAGEGNYGGQTYWSNRLESTRQAVASREWQPGPGARLTWSLPTESCQAIHDAFQQSMIDELWREAARGLRSQAQRMRDALQAQADDVAKALAELK